MSAHHGCLILAALDGVRVNIDSIPALSLVESTDEHGVKRVGHGDWLPIAVSGNQLPDLTGKAEVFLEVTPGRRFKLIEPAIVGGKLTFKASLAA